MTARSKKPPKPRVPRRPEPGPTRHRPSTGWFAAALIVAGVAVYANGLRGPFVFDDLESVVTNPHVLHLWPAGAAMSARPDTPSAGRPLVSLSLAVNYALGGFSPWGYHAWNLFIHVLCGLVLMSIVRRTLGGRTLSARFGDAAPSLAFACALIWLVHPLNTEVVDYVSQRTESMMALFYLLTLYAAVRAMGHSVHSNRWAAVSAATCALGMACKESMVTAPVMVLLYDAAFETGSVWQSVRRRWRLYAGLAAGWVVLGVLVANNPRGHSAGLASSVGPWTYLLNQPSMILTYLRLSIWPHPLVLDYGLPTSITARQALPDAAILTALVAAVVVIGRRQAGVAFLAAWVFVTLAPTSTVVPIATEVGAERRMYLALAAIVVLLVLGAWCAFQWAARSLASEQLRRMPPAVLALLVVVLAVLSMSRNTEYRDPVGLWQTVVDRRPAGRAHYTLGLELGKKGRWAEATSHLLAATSEYPKAHYALGVAAEEAGRHQEAVEQLREYIRLRPLEEEVVPASLTMGKALAAEGQLEEAVAAFSRVLNMQPRNAEVRLARAEVFRRERRFDDAIREYGEYLNAVPNDSGAHNNLGLALVANGREQEAAKEFARAVELDPRDPAKEENLGLSFFELDDFDDAIRAYHRALALNPNMASVESELGAALLAEGKADEASTDFQRAVELGEPSDGVRADVAAALQKAEINRRRLSQKAH